MSTTQLTNIPELIDNVRVLMATIDDDSVHPNQMRDSIALVGAPGTAKTYTATHTFRELWADQHNCSIEEVGLIVCRCAGRDPVEFNGMGVPQKADLYGREDWDGRLSTQNTIPDLLIEIESARQGHHRSTNGKKAKCILLVLDEALQADASVQKTLSSLLYRNENTLGGFDAGPDICVILTGNRSQDKAGATKMLSMNRDRVVFFELEGYTPATIKSANEHYKKKNMTPIMTQYVDQHLDNAPWDAVMESDRSHMTFRSFYMTAKTIETYMRMHKTVKLSDGFAKTIAAKIGTAGADSIKTYLENLANGVPTADEIMADPANCSLPDDIGAQVSAGGVALLAVTDSSTAEAALEYMSRMRTDLQVQLMAQVIHLSGKGGYIMNTARAAEFIGKHSSLIELLTDLNG
jgi:hypothetical protein